MNRKSLWVMVMLGLSGLGPVLAQQQSVRALLQLQADRLDVLLVGREGDQIYYRRHDAPEGSSAALKAANILGGEFEVEIDESLVNTALKEKKWDVAAQLILARVNPALPYLDIRDNNAVDPAIQAGSFLMLAARKSGREEGDRARKTAERFYQAAFQVFRAVQRSSDWHPFGEAAGFRAVLCQIALGKLDEATSALAKARVPARGDGAFGIYALAQAKLKHARGDARVAIDLLIPSLLYENKDIDVFPEVLMLLAQCYEEINEIHRTRDVFYEIARIFPGTEWADVARERLVVIRRENMTKDVEDVAVTTVFFAGKEDMDALVDEYLEKSDIKTEK